MKTEAWNQLKEAFKTKAQAPMGDFITPPFRARLLIAKGL